MSLPWGASSVRPCCRNIDQGGETARLPRIILIKEKKEWMGRLSPGPENYEWRKGLHSLQDKVCVQCYMKRSNQKPGSQGCSWWVLGNGSCRRGEGIVSKDLSSNMASDSLYSQPDSNAYYPGRTCGRIGTCRKKKNKLVLVKSLGKFYTVYIHIPCFTPEIKKVSTSGTDVV